MRMVEKIRQLLSPRGRLLDRLAETAADAEALAENLTRHTEMCSFPTLRAGLKELAAAETVRANAMRQLLLQNSVRPKCLRNPPHQGASNWERLRNDLALQVKILRALRSQFSEWTAIDPLIAEQLRECATEEDRHVEQLRDLTLKCDPQALD
jgi:hypothetical protein